MQYTLISSGKSKVHIHFPGQFNNNKIIWDATIQTLESIELDKSEKGIKQFIHIIDNGNDVNNDIKSISIGLNVKSISKPEILKTIIMITNYKDLRIGRHEYGKQYFFD